ncbi:UDP-4-amino-4,6-dideoxy-N-acetyl-beta-L-altrosamine transaminase [Pseudomonadota bacterium]
MTNPLTKSKHDATSGYGRQWLDDDDRRAVRDVLDGPFLTQGSKVAEFEAALCEATGAKYAVAVSSGTAALHIACLAAGLKPGDHAVTSAITFLASANAPIYCGAECGFADVDPLTVSVSAQTIRAAMDRQNSTRVVIPVHFAGLSTGARELRAVVGDEATIIEDACHAFGGVDEEGVPVGSCAHADMAILSFHPVKSVTTAEGGAVTTNDAELAHQLRLLRSHGMVRDAEEWNHPEDGLEGAELKPWYYEQQVLGFNFRMTELQAALGLSQMGKLGMFMAKRRVLATHYIELLKDLDFVRPIHDAQQVARSANHLLAVRMDFSALGRSRRAVMQYLTEREIGSQVHYIPVYRQPYHAQRSGLGKADFPMAEEYYAQCLSLPLHVGMEIDDVAYVVDVLKKMLGTHK